MQNNFRILVEPSVQGTRTYWKWVATHAERDVHAGLEDSPIEAMESAACALGYYLDCHPEYTPVVISIDLNLGADQGGAELAAGKAGA